MATRRLTFPEPFDAYAHALRRSPAQVYATLFGLALITVGATGFISNASFNQVDFQVFDFDDGDVVNGDLYFGVFEVNGPHNLLHFGSGLFLLAVSLREAWARAGVLVFGVVYIAVTVLGFIDSNDLLGTFTVNVGDNILHAALGVLAVAAALLPTRNPHPPADEVEETRPLERAPSSPRTSA